MSADITAINAIDQYRDPSLDGMIENRAIVNRRAAAAAAAGSAPPSKRAMISDLHNGGDDFDHPTQLMPPQPPPPPAAAAAAAPPTAANIVPGLTTIIHPTSNTNSDATPTGVQRSFSQRARGRLISEEALLHNDDYDDDQDNVDNIRVPENDVELTPARQQSTKQADPKRAPSTRDGDARLRGRIIQDNLRSAANSVRSPKDSRPRRNSGNETGRGDVIPGMTRTSTLRDAANQTDEERRDWAPDRSPLQKLEVTLSDISKEEKRARALEAEMLHREKSRARRADRAAPIATPASRSRAMDAQPRTIQDAGLVRNLSNTHKDRLQHSTTIDSHRPDPRRLSAERPGFEYQSVAAPPARSVSITRAQAPTSVQIRRNDPTAVAATSRSVSNPSNTRPSVPTADSLPQATTSTRSTSGPQFPSSHRSRDDEPVPRYVPGSHPTIPAQEHRTLTAQERNASHKAALEQLTGASSTRSSLRSQPRELRNNTNFEPSTNSMPRSTGEFDNVNRPRHQGDQASIPSQPVVANGTTSRDMNEPSGLGLPAGLAPTAGAPSAMLTNGQPNKRRSSVSFKDPYERRRPVDEWKAAETARLTAADFSFDSTPSTTDDADKDKAWWEQDAKERRRSNRTQAGSTPRDASIRDQNAEFSPRLFLKCGPLLRYTGMSRTSERTSRDIWRGTVMIVTQDSQSNLERAPTLRLFSQPKRLLSHPPSMIEDGQLPPEHVDPITGAIKLSRIGRALYVRPVEHLEESKDLSQIETDEGLFQASLLASSRDDGRTTSAAPAGNHSSHDTGERFGKHKEIRGVRLYADPDRDVTFWLFKIEIELLQAQQNVGYRINNGASQGFWVPAKGETMNIMFHSCNGFSQTVNPNEFSGPDPLWRDVLNAHQSRPFHVMIGGGDQIYNDKAMRFTEHFKEWTANKNPHYKHHAPMTVEMREELETFYLESYSRWFSQGLFSLANAQIPMVNMWDDHDIMDGFGSYPHAFMLSPVFSGVGNIAYKYYMLFQQQSVDGMTMTDEPSWVLGHKPGPYINKPSRSIFLDLGRRVALLALDCRTERMKNQVLSLDTTDIALERCRRGIVEGQTRHLLVLLGVPIAYPRMNWLENVLTSRVMDPVKAAGRYGILKGGFLNKFDGGVEILDDLDDHWTASGHKQERNEFIQELQDLAAEKSVRITILGGDVHLAAIGQFYSNPKLKIPKDHDHRYMPNVISSAIVNTPPPDALADVLNKRNKIHHLDHYTDESMIPMFTHDTNMKKRNNRHLLPRRNWCSITEYIPGKTPPSSRGTSPSRASFVEGDQGVAQPKRKFSLSKENVNPRTLFRRISSRGAPPNAYRDGEFPTEPGEAQPRAASFDTPTRSQSQTRSLSDRVPFMRRSSSENRGPQARHQAVPQIQVNGQSQTPARPGFHRRPTNLSEKAARKGNMPGLDAEGNEIEINHHVNLEGGLDIVLNCEVDQHDPSGITEPYRLLVPALWYDGSSDREKLYDQQGQKQGFMGRMGLGGKGGQKAAQNQGAGNWGQDMSESGTEDSASDVYNSNQQPKKKLGLFGSLRRKRQPDQEDLRGERDQPEFESHVGAFRPGEQARNFNGSPMIANEQPNSAMSRSIPMTTNGMADLRGRPHEAQFQPQQPQVGPARAAFNQPPAQSRQIMPAGPDEYEPLPPPKRSNSFKANNLLRKPQRKNTRHDEAPEVVPPEINRSGLDSRTQPLAAAVTTPRQFQYDQSQAQPTVPPLNANTYRNQQSYEPPANTTDFAPKPVRQNSYTISSNRGSRATSHTSQPSPTMQDNVFPPSRHSSTHHQSRGVSNPVMNPPTAYTADNSANLPSRAPSYRANDDRRISTRPLSSHAQEQEPIVGIATPHDAFSGNPQQRSLRGNGIIGRDVPSSSTTRHRSTSEQAPSNDHSHHHQHHHHHHHDPDTSGDSNFNPQPPQRTLSQGYTGIDAYSSKPKRGASLRDRARGLFSRGDRRPSYSGREYGPSDDHENHSDNSAGWENESDDGQNKHQKLIPRYNPEQHGREQEENYHDEGSSHSGSYEEYNSYGDEDRGLRNKLRLGIERMRSGRGSKRGKIDDHGGPERATMERNEHGGSVKRY